MFKLVKYEFKSLYKSLLGFLVALAVLTIFSFFGSPTTKNESIVFLFTTIGFVAISIAIFVVVFLNCIQSLSKYLYKSEGYLLFSTPQSGYSIIGSRLIVAFIEIIGSQLVLGVFFYFAVIHKVLKTENITNFWSTLFSYMDASMIGIVAYIFISFLLSLIAFLITVYFSMILSKSLIPFQKNQGVIAFVAFIVINLVISSIGSFVGNIINISIKTNYAIQGTINLGEIIIENGFISLSLGSIIFTLLISVILFIASSYLIDNKLEL